MIYIILVEEECLTVERSKPQQIEYGTGVTTWNGYVSKKSTYLRRLLMRRHNHDEESNVYFEFGEKIFINYQLIENL